MMYYQTSNYTNPNMGWICPKCGKVYAPTVEGCPSCNTPQISGGWAGTTVIGTGVAGGITSSTVSCTCNKTTPAECPIHRYIFTYTTTNPTLTHT